MKLVTIVWPIKNYSFSAPRIFKEDIPPQGKGVGLQVAGGQAGAGQGAGGQGTGGQAAGGLQGAIQQGPGLQEPGWRVVGRQARSRQTWIWEPGGQAAAWR